MSTEPSRLDVLRCADQDRELVAQLLNNAYADGRLRFEEHAERISRAYDAKTFGDLNALTTDLVAPSPTSLPPSTPYPAPRYGGNVSTLDAFTGGNALLSTFAPGSLGTIAPDVTINAWLGEVKLDLVGATFDNRATIFRLGGLMCDVAIRLPEGISVDVSGLSMVMSETKVDGVVPHVDGILIKFVGTVVMGNLTVLGPATKRARKYAKLGR